MPGPSTPTSPGTGASRRPPPACSPSGSSRRASARRDFVLEGGGVDVNGRGTLLTTEECYLSRRKQVRNPGLGRKGFEAAVRDWLGVTNVFWLGRGIAGDDTHGHVDDICRFVNPRTLVLIEESDPAGSELPPPRRELGADSRPAARGRLEARGRGVADARARSTTTASACPRATRTSTSATRRSSSRPSTTRTTASPSASSAELFEDRPVVGIHAVDLVLGFGTLHCLTQQQPSS